MIFGWENVAKKLRGYKKGTQLPKNNENNPVMENYMFNMKYQNLENPYFNSSSLSNLTSLINFKFLFLQRNKLVLFQSIQLFLVINLI